MNRRYRGKGFGSIGRPVRGEKPLDKKESFHITSEDKEKLDYLCKRRGLNKSEVLRKALNVYYDLTLDGLY